MQAANIQRLDEYRIAKSALAAERMDMPTHGDYPWERDKRRIRIRTGALVCVVIATIVGGVQLGAPGGIGVGATGPVRP